ncbi:MAG: lipopolysaccharide biosynthesis protein [Bacteroidales bacterium]
MKGALLKIIKEANFLSLSGNITIAFFGIASFAVLTRSFPIEIFGQWVLYISTGNFIDMFRFGITNTAIVRYLSGVDKDERIRFIGSNGLIGLLATIGLAIIIWGCHFAFGEPIRRAGYELFFTWYPLLAFFTLPFNTAVVVMQADQKFSTLLWIKAVNSGGFFLLLLLNYLIFKMSLMQLIWVQLGINLITSAICIFYGWDGLRYITKATVRTNKLLLHFGKYTTFTIIGTNLLRTADTLIISLSPMGTAAVALYSIPLKLTELQQIPLRSFAATAFPKLSKASIQGKMDEVKNLFYSYSGAMTYLFIAISVITFVFADFFVLLLGGSKYVVTDPTTRSSVTNIVRVFSVYGLLLPLDRMTGVGLDSINKPDLNLWKVGVMVAANVIGDLIAVFIFKSLAAIALASLLFTALGVWVGYYYLNKELVLDYRRVFSDGIGFYKDIYLKIRQKKFQ